MRYKYEPEEISREGPQDQYNSNNNKTQTNIKTHPHGNKCRRSHSPIRSPPSLCAWQSPRDWRPLAFRTDAASDRTPPRRLPSTVGALMPRGMQRAAVVQIGHGDDCQPTMTRWSRGNERPIVPGRYSSSALLLPLAADGRGTPTSGDSIVESFIFCKLSSQSIWSRTTTRASQRSTTKTPIRSGARTEQMKMVRYGVAGSAEK